MWTKQSLGVDIAVPVVGVTVMSKIHRKESGYTLCLPNRSGSFAAAGS